MTSVPNVFHRLILSNVTENKSYYRNSKCKHSMLITTDKTRTPQVLVCLTFLLKLFIALHCLAAYQHLDHAFLNYLLNYSSYL